MEKITPEVNRIKRDKVCILKKIIMIDLLTTTIISVVLLIIRARLTVIFITLPKKNTIFL